MPSPLTLDIPGVHSVNPGGGGGTPLFFSTQAEEA